MLIILAMAAENVPAFTPMAADLARRTMIQSQVTWQPQPWPRAGIEFKTPDLSRLVQETVSGTSWQSGNAIGFMIAGTGKRSAYSFEGDPARAAVLEIEYVQ